MRTLHEYEPRSFNREPQELVMNKLARLTAYLLGIVLIAALAGLGQIAAQSTTSPPVDLKLVGDHWTPWDPPTAGPDAYLIKKGDTLWDLSAAWLGDPFLWPQIWDENRYILDSHWIYPGDPLVIPGTPTVVPDGGPPKSALDTPPDPDEPDGDSGDMPPVTEPTPAPRPAPLQSIAADSDLQCSGYIASDGAAGDLILSDLMISGREIEREHSAAGDVVYLNHGRDQGLEAGASLGILRKENAVSHPATGDVLGTFVRRIGRLRIMLVHPTSSTAVIEMSCTEVNENDMLVAWTDIPVPMFREKPAFDRYDVTPSGGLRAHVVHTFDSMNAVGEGNIIYTDLGAGSGVAPGDVLTLFRENDGENLPRLNLGQAVILTVESTTSTALITRSVRETRIGDEAEVK
jgi:hypothetical protein